MRPLDGLATIKRKLGVAIVIAVAVSSIVSTAGLRLGVPLLLRPVISAALALAMVQVLARGMTSPLREMASASRAMARGEHGRRVTATSRDEVGELARAFNAMATDLEELDRLRRDLVANVSHELRTPITALQAVLENLVDGVERPDPETFRTMLKQVERLGRLVTQLLDLSRLESGTVPLQRRRFPVRGLLEDAAEECRLHAPATAVEVRVEPPDLELDADPERVHQVVANLLENAVRHSPPGGPVRVSASTTDDGRSVRLEVVDEGPGIPDEDAGRIFERFYRADAARRSSDGGAGLGLAIARWVVELHAGSIRPERATPTGCRMVVELPVAPPAGHEPIRSRRTEMTTTASVDEGPVPAAPLLPTALPDVGRATPPDRRVLLAVAVAAIGTDLAVRSGVNGIAGAGLVVAVAVGLLASGRVTNRSAWPLLAAAPVFGLGLVFRASEWLQLLDVAAAAGLLALGASLGRSGDATDQSVPDLLGRAVHLAVHAVLGPAFLLSAGDNAASHGGRRSTTAAVARGALLGAPVVLVLGLLLGSADPVFASFFRFPTDAGDVVAHLVLLVIGASGAAMLLRTTSSEPYDLDLHGRRFLGNVEASTVVAGLVAVFAAFSASQVAAVVGGADYVRRTAGLSYAEHARSGFFQLLVAAALTLGVLLLVRAAVRDPEAKALVGLSEAAVVLTLLLVAGAVRRLGLYEQAYGLTVLRLWAVLFAIWIGGVFVLLGFSIAGAGRPRRWFVPAAIALALGGLLVLQVGNVEGLVAARNIDRFAGSVRFDAAVLADLSDDAVPTIVDHLDRLTPTERADVLARICVDPNYRGPGGFWAFNGAEDAAADARARVCPTGGER